MKINKIAYLFAVVLFIQVNVYAQQPYPVIGKQCPKFNFSNIQNYPTDKICNQSLKGKWLVLDFWSYTCGGCLNSFPKMNKLKRDFADEANFFMVGITKGKAKKYNPIAYERLKKLYNLDLTVIYDSTVFEKWGVAALPYIVVIDPGGIVNAITMNISDSLLRSIMSGENPKYLRAYSKFEPQMETDSSFFAKNYNILYRSLITRWDPLKVRYKIPSKIFNSQYIHLNGVNLNSLYKFAFIGQAGLLNGDIPIVDSVYRTFYPNLIIENRNGQEADHHIQFEDTYYCYNLKLPSKVSKQELMIYMQQDLERYFPYHAFVKKQDVPCWYLTVSNKGREKLKTNGRATKKIFNINGQFGFQFQNVPMSYLINILNSNLGGEEWPIFDSTKITENIDIVIDAYMNEFSEVEKALSNQGLTLVKGTKRMNAVVIQKE